MPARGVIDVWQVQMRPGDDRDVPLRAVLSRYLDSQPELVREVRGKPYVHGRPLEFSYSHSGGLALVAVAPDCLVGIDVEHLRPARPVERIARRMFSRAEAAALEAVAEGARAAAFHRCWTGKEAYVKGLGTGLGHGLARFSVAGLVAGRPRVDVGGWQVAQLDVPGGYAAALAAPGSGWQINPRMLDLAHG